MTLALLVVGTLPLDVVLSLNFPVPRRKSASYEGALHRYCGTDINQRDLILTRCHSFCYGGMLISRYQHQRWTESSLRPWPSVWLNQWWDQFTIDELLVIMDYWVVPAELALIFWIGWWKSSPCGMTLWQEDSSNLEWTGFSVQGNALDT